LHEPEKGPPRGVVRRRGAEFNGKKTHTPPPPIYIEKQYIKKMRRIYDW